MFDQRGVEWKPVWEDENYYYTFDSTALPKDDQAGGEIEVYRKGSKKHKHAFVVYPDGSYKGKSDKRRYLKR